MLALVVSCTGVVVGDPAVEVSQLGLTANPLGALIADECMLKGQQSCATYPNPKACDQLLVSILGDGSTVGHCSIKGQVEQIIHGIAEGIPITCRLSPDQGCVRCVDLYGSVVVDACDGHSSPAQPDKEGFQHPNAGAEPPSTAPSVDAQACIQKTQQAFVDKLNQVLKDEGFNFTYAPDLGKLPSNVVLGAGTLLANGTLPLVDLAVCDPLAVVQGHCFCHSAPLLGVRCTCARLVSKALGAAILGTKPPECNAAGWTAAMLPIYGAATKWLNAVPIGVTGLVGSPSVASAKGPSDIVCLGSPLVLDLNNDGVELSSVSAGVTFDLTGAGPLRTAWVRGADDALLAIDRDGNGTIDGGGELFGEGTVLQGRTAADGFEALAALDRPEQGGNGNGLVDAGDFMFDQLVLWRDADHDGRSGPGELVSLAAAGIAGLEVRGSAATTVIDRHGNDLSLRARYLRADGGSGLLVDALFVTSAP